MQPSILVEFEVNRRTVRLIGWTDSHPSLSTRRQPRCAAAWHAGPEAPRRQRPACLPAQSAAPPRPRDSYLPPCATSTLCDSAPTPSVLRSRRPTRMACHLSPPSRGEPSQSFPAPCSAERDFPNSPNYQGLRPAFATTTAALLTTVPRLQPALVTTQMNDMPLDLSQSDLQARRGQTRTHV